MSPRQRNAVPMVYGIVVIATLLFWRSAFVPVLVVGAMLVGATYALVRPTATEGRPRRRRA